MNEAIDIIGIIENYKTRALKAEGKLRDIEALFKKELFPPHEGEILDIIKGTNNYENIGRNNCSDTKTDS